MSGLCSAHQNHEPGCPRCAPTPAEIDAARAHLIPARQWHADNLAVFDADDDLYYAMRARDEAEVRAYDLGLVGLDALAREPALLERVKELEDWEAAWATEGKRLVDRIAELEVALARVREAAKRVVEADSDFGGPRLDALEAALKGG